MTCCAPARREARRARPAGTARAGRNPCRWRGDGMDEPPEEFVRVVVLLPKVDGVAHAPERALEEAVQVVDAGFGEAAGSAAGRGPGRGLGAGRGRGGSGRETREPLHLADDLAQVKALPPELQAAPRLQAGEVEDVVDQRKERLGRGADGLHLLALGGAKPLRRSRSAMLRTPCMGVRIS